MSISVVIHTCDSYEFCWEGWWYYFNKYWEFTLPWNIYFVNECKDVVFDSTKVKQFKTGVGEWSERLRKVLNVIETEYVFYMQEDVWLVQSIDGELFNNLYDICSDNDFNKVFLSGCNIYSFNECRKCTEFKVKDGYLYKINRWEPYLMSHQPSIWNREFLLSCLTRNETPWNNEINESLRLRNYKGDLKFYHYIAGETNEWNVWHNNVSISGEINKFGEELLERMKND